MRRAFAAMAGEAGRAPREHDVGRIPRAISRRIGRTEERHGGRSHCAGEVERAGVGGDDGARPPGERRELEQRSREARDRRAPGGGDDAMRERLLAGSPADEGRNAAPGEAPRRARRSCSAGQSFELQPPPGWKRIGRSTASAASSRSTRAASRSNGGSGNSRRPTAARPRAPSSARFLSMTCTTPAGSAWRSVSSSDESGSRRAVPPKPIRRRRPADARPEARLPESLEVERDVEARRAELAHGPRDRSRNEGAAGRNRHAGGDRRIPGDERAPGGLHRPDDFEPGRRERRRDRQGVHDVADRRQAHEQEPLAVRRRQPRARSRNRRGEPGGLSGWKRPGPSQVRMLADTPRRRPRRPAEFTGGGPPSADAAMTGPRARRKFLPQRRTSVARRRVRWAESAWIR